MIDSQRWAPQAQTTRSNRNAPLTKTTADASRAAPIDDQVQLSQLSEDAELASMRRQLAQTEVVPNEVLIKVKSDPGLLESLSSDFKAEITESFDFPDSFQGRIVKLQLSEGTDLARTLVSLRRDERVAFAEPNQVIELAAFDSKKPDDLDPQLWGLHNTGQSGGTKGADIKAPGAWGVHTGDWNSAPLVAVLDTGVDYTHSDLAANIWKNKGEIPGDGLDNDNNGVVDDVYGYNAHQDNGDPMDAHGHGTHCAGTIGAVGNNGKGIAGVAWQANIMPVRIFDNQGRGSADGIIRGILYAAKMKAEVTNNSWVSLLPNEAIKDAFASSDALHVTAAGNNNYLTDRRPLYPMGFDLPNIISVGATDHNDRKAGFSNYGVQTVDVTAPGHDIYSTKPGESYQYMSGTSMATPHVTGLVSLIKDAHPDVSNQDVMDRIFYSSDPVESLAEVSASGGRINAARALEHDTTAPASPKDFSVTKKTSRTVTMGWTATGDDGWCGDAVGYELYVSSEPITEENLSQVSRVESGRVSAVGELERVPLSFSADETQDRHFFSALKIVDNVGQRSELIGAEFSVPAARLHFGEGGSSQWSPEGSWQNVETEGRSGVWSTAPLGGEYDNNLSMSLTTGPIDLSHAKDTMLSYEAKYNLPAGDAVFVEVTADQGETWKSVRAMSRRSGDDWRYSEVDLSRFDGETIQLRYRLRTDEEGQSWGALVDNVRVISD